MAQPVGLTIRPGWRILGPDEILESSDRCAYVSNVVKDGIKTEWWPIGSYVNCPARTLGSSVVCIREEQEKEWLNPWD